MKMRFLTLGLICLFVFPLIAEEKIIFKSELKDADFHPFSSKVGMNNIGWWTLKFENDAVIRIWTEYKSKPKDEIWWIGKKYKVTTDGKFLHATIIEENKESK